MDEQQLRHVLQDCLGGRFTTVMGQILYSGIDTLTTGDYYFLGFNPAADGTNRILSQTALNANRWSAYIDQCWTCGEHRGCKQHRRKPHQNRVQAIMEALEQDPWKTFASNVIFAESATARELDRADLFEPCWCVHQHLLAIVKPKCIVCLGNGEQLSAFSLVRQKAENRTQERSLGRLKSFRGTFALGPKDTLYATVVGVPHPSRWNGASGLREFVRGETQGR